MIKHSGPSCLVLYIPSFVPLFIFKSYFLIFPQLLLFLKAFSASEQTKLAMLTGILLANGSFPATILTSLFSDNLVKEGNI